MKFKEIIKKHGKNYFFASLFLPSKIQKDVFAFYAFVRFFDDIVDEENDLNKFLKYKLEFLEDLKQKKSKNIIFEKILNIIQKYNIKKDYFLSFLESMESDFSINRYQKWENLNKYIYGSAEVIGLILTKIFETNNDKAYYYAQKLGYAMQLTNFLRDFGEDYYKRNRIYFPKEELDKFNLTEEDFDKKIVNDKIINFAKHQIFKIKEIYKEANVGIKFIKCVRCKLAVILASNLYCNILNKIQKNNYNILTIRAFNNKIDFIKITIRSIFQLFLKK